MTQLEIIKNKIYPSFEVFEKRLEFFRFKKYQMVFTNGCFDILHLGHIDYLSKASDLGEILIVGLNSDNSIKKIKGNNRPINDVQSRSLLLASMSFVSAVVIFEEETPENLIKLIKPDVLVKGKDYSFDTIVGANHTIQNGGQVVTIELIEGYSTSNIINNIVKFYSKKDKI